MTDQTNQHLAYRDFEAFVETIAENNRERDGSSTRFVANHAIIGSEYIKEDGGGFALTFNARPYYDGKRAWPKDVLHGAPMEYYPYQSSTDDPSLRELAVDVLVKAMELMTDNWFPDDAVEFMTIVDADGDMAVLEAFDEDGGYVRTEEHHDSHRLSAEQLNKVYAPEETMRRDERDY